MRPALRDPSTWWIAGYSCLVLLLLPLQSLWLDEILQLMATRSSFHALMSGYASHSAGQSPLEPVQQFLLIKIFGYSVWVARLPAALGSIFACIGIVRLARSAGSSSPWITFLLFASFPLQLRYATEARPYSQMLCVAVWLTIIAVNLIARIEARCVSGYLALLVIGLYCQPFVVFVAIAHASYAVITRRFRAAITFGLCTAADAVLYLPWYLQSRHNWQVEVNTVQLHFHWESKLPLLILRELVGTGYIGTVLLAFAIVSGWRRPSSCVRPDRLFWLFCIFIPIVLAVATDARFDYFFAIRQVIIVLPAIAILATSGMSHSPRSAAGCLAAALLLLNLGYSIRWFTKPRENWDAAAAIVSDAVDSGACVIAPEKTIGFFAFFRPGLPSHECNERSFNQSKVVELAISPYVHDADQERSKIRDLLMRSGFQGPGVERFANPKVIEFRR